MDLLNSPKFSPITILHYTVIYTCTYYHNNINNNWQGKVIDDKIKIYMHSRCLYWLMLSYLTILLYQLGEVGKQWMMFPEKIKLVTPLFPLHQPLQEWSSILCHKLCSQLYYIPVMAKCNLHKCKEFYAIDTRYIHDIIWYGNELLCAIFYC